MDPHWRKLRIKVRRNRRRSLTGKRGEENRGRSLISNRDKKQIGEPLQGEKVEKAAVETCAVPGGGVEFDVFKVHCASIASP